MGRPTTTTPLKKSHAQNHLVYKKGRKGLSNNGNTGFYPCVFTLQLKGFYKCVVPSDIVGVVRECISGKVHIKILNIWIWLPRRWFWVRMSYFGSLYLFSYDMKIG